VDDGAQPPALRDDRDVTVASVRNSGTPSFSMLVSSTASILRRCCCNEMAKLGVPLFRTDRDGDVAVVSQGGRLSTSSTGQREHRRLPRLVGS